MRSLTWRVLQRQDTSEEAAMCTRESKIQRPQRSVDITVFCRVRPEGVGVGWSGMGGALARAPSFQHRFARSHGLAAPEAPYRWGVAPPRACARHLLRALRLPPLLLGHILVASHASGLQRGHVRRE